jgi:hypothetical protein
VSGGKRSRRDWLRETSRLALGIPLGALSLAELAAFEEASAASVVRAAKSWPLPGPPYPGEPYPAQSNTPVSDISSLFPSDPTKYRFTLEEDRFLEQVERACFQFFWDEASPYTGLVKDRSSASGSDSRNVASIAATGFGLTGLCIADHRGWEDKRKIRERVKNTLRFVATRVPQAHGFFCHFLNFQNGERAFSSEVSSIDTALFLCGVLTCKEYFDDDEIASLADTLYGRLDFNWLLHGEKNLSMGWTPEHGFIKARWDAYSESAVDESELGRVDAHIFRIQRDPVYRVARAAVCASVFAGVVRLSREARRVCGLFYEFGDRNEGAQVVVFGVGA